MTEYAPPPSTPEVVPVMPEQNEYFMGIKYQYPSWQQSQATQPEADDSVVQRREQGTLPIVQQTYEYPVSSVANTTTDLMRSAAPGFNIKSLSIDNASGQWFWIPILGCYVPPFVHGRVANLISGAGLLDVIAQTPPGETSIPTAGQVLTITCYSVNQWPSAGNQLQTETLSATVNQGVPGASPWLITGPTTPSASHTVGTGEASAVDGSFTNTVKQISGTQVRLYDVIASNPGGSKAYLQIFMQPAAGVVLGTTAPDYVIPLPALGDGAQNWGAGLDGTSTGLSYAATATPTGAGAPAANCSASFGYR